MYIYAACLFSSIEYFYLRRSCIKDSTLSIGCCFSFVIIVVHSSYASIDIY